MSKAVVDASVAFKWLVDEGDQEEALAFASNYDLIAPDILDIEVFNALWVRCRRGFMDRRAVEQALSLLGAMPVQRELSANLAARAGRLAFHLDIAIYDCLYWALAEQEGIALATADGPLIKALRRNRTPTSLVIPFL